jgi:hypothetical protein
VVSLVDSLRLYHRCKYACKMRHPLWEDQNSSRCFASSRRLNELSQCEVSCTVVFGVEQRRITSIDKLPASSIRPIFIGTQSTIHCLFVISQVNSSSAGFLDKL